MILKTNNVSVCKFVINWNRKLCMVLYLLRIRLVPICKYKFENEWTKNQINFYT